MSGSTPETVLYLDYDSDLGQAYFAGLACHASAARTGPESGSSLLAQTPPKEPAQCAQIILACTRSDHTR